MNLRRLIIYWIPVVAWILLIMWTSSGDFSSERTSLIITPTLKFLLPSAHEATIDKIHALIRKIAHFTEYFILGFLLFHAFRGTSVGTYHWRLAAYSLAVVVLVATADEMHQLTVPSRSGSIIDVSIDTSGGIFSQAFSILWRRRRTDDNHKDAPVRMQSRG